MDNCARIFFFRTTEELTVNKLANMAVISQSYQRDVELRKKKSYWEILSFVCDALIFLFPSFLMMIQQKGSPLNLSKYNYRLNSVGREKL